MTRRWPARLAAYEEALRAPVPERSSEESAPTPFVAGAHLDEEDAPGRTEPRPFWPDGKLRTQEDLITLAIKELHYERSSAPRREVLAQAIATARRNC